MTPEAKQLRICLIGATLISSWLAMQFVHELGHMLGASITGGHVQRVVLHPLTISRTDLQFNPRPLAVCWAGPLFGATVPLLAWLAGRQCRCRGIHLLRFFAGFCLLANGLYLGIGSFDGVGDCGDLQQLGVPNWQLWLFGTLTAPIGLYLWHGLGPFFGLGSKPHSISRRTTVTMCLVTLALIVNGLLSQFFF